jgi:hypothetical protein
MLATTFGLNRPSDKTTVVSDGVHILLDFNTVFINNEIYHNDVTNLIHFHFHYHKHFTVS